MVAQQLLEPELKNLRLQLYSQLAQPQFSGLELSKKLFEGLSSISSQTSEQRRNAQWLIRFTIEFFRSALWKLTGQTTAAPTSIDQAEPFSVRMGNSPDGIERLGALIDRTVDASKDIDDNIGVPMCLDSLYDDLARLIRPPQLAR